VILLLFLEENLIMKENRNFWHFLVVAVPGLLATKIDV
jgi:hypothetical protein